MNNRGLVLTLRLLGVGWYVGTCIAGGGVGGYVLDRYFGLNPLFTILGIGAGVLLAVLGMYRMLLNLTLSGTHDKN